MTGDETVNVIPEEVCGRSSAELLLPSAWNHRHCSPTHSPAPPRLAYRYAIIAVGLTSCLAVGVHGVTRQLTLWRLGR